MYREAGGAGEAAGSVPAAPAPSLRRVAFLGVALGAALAAHATSHTEPSYLADPELVRLLRGMAAIKGGIVVLVLGLALWRMGWRVAPLPGALYSAGVAAMSGASVWIWQLSAIAPAAILFHAGIAALLVGALVDGGGPGVPDAKPRLTPDPNARRTR
jgi:hypothetical protein